MLNTLLAIIKSFKASTFLFSTILIVGLLVFSNLGLVSQSEIIQVSGIAVNNSLNNQSRYINELQRSRLTNVQQYEISLEGKALDSGYGNLFQTDDGPKAVRIELNKPNTISLIFFDNSEGIYVLSDNFELNQWHKFRMIGVKNQFTKLYLDSKLVFEATKENTKIYKDGNEITRPANEWVTGIKGDFGSLAVGTGFSKGRDLVGEVRDFNIRIEFIKNWNIFNICALIIALLVFSFQAMKAYMELNSRVTKIAFQTFRKGFALLGLILLVAFLGNLIANIGPTYQKWIPFICVGLTLFVFPWVTVNATNEVSAVRQSPINLLYFLSLLLLLIFIFKAFLNNFLLLNKFNLFIMSLATVSVAGIGLIVLQEKTLIKRGLLFISLVILSMASWASLFEIPNWINWSTLLVRYSPSTLAISLLILALLIRCLLINPTSDKKIHPIYLLVPYLGIFIIFILLSFRYDTLFLGSSEYHWEYFVGPVRSIRNGGWLLWDVPSQYGFLNILLTAMIPVKSSWQSLYLFQAGLLLVVSSSLFATLMRINARNLLFHFLLVVISIFFADPDLIGPQLYPSSSVFRFFWCYILILVLINGTFSSIRADLCMKIGMLAWLFGCLWSFESAIYSSAIYFSGILAYVFCAKPISKIYRLKAVMNLVSWLSASFFLLGVAVELVTFFYQMKLGFGPDWRMFAEYALSYGSGFGGIPVNVFGPVWIYLLLFFGIYSVVYFQPSHQISKDKFLIIIAASLGVILSLATYLIGRAHGSNVTAVLPIICMILLVAIKIQSANTPPNLFLFTIATPILLLTFAGILSQPNTLSVFVNFRTLTPMVESRLRLPDTNLSRLLVEAKISPGDYIVYYGFNAAMPMYLNAKGTVEGYENTWLPNPFQLLEEPISTERRSAIINRAVDRKKESGYLVQANGQFEDRFNEWLEVLSTSYSIQIVSQNQSYKLFLFKKI